MKKLKVFYYDNKIHLNTLNQDFSFEYTKVENSSQIYIDLTKKGLLIFHEEYLKYYIILKLNNIYLRKVGSKIELNINENDVKSLDKFDFEPKNDEHTKSS